MRNQPLPLIAITGFLGSGKTSLLKNFLRQQPFPPENSALIINDIGAVNIDSILLSRAGLFMQSITGGCVCCTSYQELIDALLVFYEQETVKIVWIETSGLAEPEEMLDHLTSSQLHEKITLSHLIEVVDAAHFPAPWRHRAIEEEQLRYADTIILNKIDLINEKKKEALLKKISSSNPRAKIIPSIRGEVAFSQLADHSAGEEKVSLEPINRGGAEHLHASTFYFPLSTPLKRNEFEKKMNQLPEGVYRAKGFVCFEDNPEQIFIFQQVAEQHELLLLPIKTKPSLGLVFIGPQLEPAALKKSLEPLLGKTGNERLPLV